MTLSKRKDRFVETDIDGEIVVMELEHGAFYSLTGTGAAIWRLIDGSRDRAMLLDTLTGEFAGQDSDIARDVDSFLAEMRDAGLVDLD